VIGIDGSDQSRLALRWGASLAERAKVPARAVQAWSYSGASVLPGTSVPESRENMDEQTAAEVRGIVEEALGKVPAFLEIQPLRGPAAAAILDTVGPNSVLCMGSRGRGGFKGMLLGSVSRACVEHAGCPVVIARQPDDDHSGPIVVGIDGSEGAAVALDWALSVADLTGSSVAAVHAWEVEASESKPRLHERLHAEAQAKIDKWLRDHTATVEQVESEGDPREMLVQAAKERNASLIVVGRRGTSRLLGLSTGGVSSYLVSNSPTSVAVIPPPDDK